MTSRRLNRKTGVDPRRRIRSRFLFRDLAARSIDLPISGKVGIVGGNAAKGGRDRGETNFASKW